MMTRAEVVDLLRKRREEYRTHWDMALSIGIANTTLSNILHGRMPPNRKVLRWLGIEKREVYIWRQG